MGCRIGGGCDGALMVSWCWGFQLEGKLSRGHALSWRVYSTDLRLEGCRGMAVEAEKRYFYTRSNQQALQRPFFIMPQYPGLAAIFLKVLRSSGARSGVT